MSLAERIAVGEVEAVAHTLLEAIRRRHGTLVIPDRPRAIDRHIDYFGAEPIVQQHGRGRHRTGGTSRYRAARRGPLNAGCAVRPERSLVDADGRGRAHASRTNPCPAIPRRNGESGHQGPIVFVVDDDWSIRESLKSLLRSAGLEVQTFASAQEFRSRGLEGWRQASFTVEPLEQVSLPRS